jgi:hypothetical protein
VASFAATRPLGKPEHRDLAPTADFRSTLVSRPSRRAFGRRIPKETRMRRLTLLLLLGLVTAGCMKSVSRGSFKRMDMAGSADATSAPGAPPAEYEPEMEKRRESMADSMDIDMDGASPEFASPAEPTTKPQPTAKPGTGEPAVEDPRKDTAGRMIIYTATMRIAVFNLAEALEKAESLPERYGGYVHSMNAAELVLKIPARKLRTAMTELAAYGVVEEKSLNSTDVSAEYVDIESRIRALEGTHKQLLELLGKARTVDEALHVRQALDQVGAELEVLKGRMRQLDSLISFSTLTLSLFERGPHTPTPSSNDPFHWVDELGVEATEWK